MKSTSVLFLLSTIGAASPVFAEAPPQDSSRCPTGLSREEHLPEALRRLERAKKCTAEAQGQVDDYSNALEAATADAADAGDTTTQPESVQTAIQELQRARQRLAEARVAQEEVEAYVNELDMLVTKAKLWRFGIGVNGAAAGAAGGREYQGLGGAFIYRLAPAFEFDFVVRADSVRGLEPETRTFPNVRLLTSFGSRGVALTLGAGAALTDAGSGVLPKIFHLALTFRPVPFRGLDACTPTLVVDLSLFVEPWLVGRTEGGVQTDSPVFFGLAATVAIGGFRAGNTDDLMYAEPRSVKSPAGTTPTPPVCETAPQRPRGRQPRPKSR